MDPVERRFYSHSYSYWLLTLLMVSTIVFHDQWSIISVICVMYIYIYMYVYNMCVCIVLFCNVMECIVCICMYMYYVWNSLGQSVLFLGKSHPWVTHHAAGGNNSSDCGHPKVDTVAICRISMGGWWVMSLWFHYVWWYFGYLWAIL